MSKRIWEIYTFLWLVVVAGWLGYLVYSNASTWQIVLTSCWSLPLAIYNIWLIQRLPD